MTDIYIIFVSQGKTMSIKIDIKKVAIKATLKYIINCDITIHEKMYSMTAFDPISIIK